MATIEQCRAAIDRLAASLSGAEDRDRARVAFDRTLSARVPDLDITFSGRLQDGEIVDVTTERDAPRAQIRLTASSEDLVALTDGRLGFGAAWLSGRIKVEAGVRDLLKLRSML